MAKFILGKKVGMTQLFGENGIAIPVTVVEAGPVTVAQLKNDETEYLWLVKMIQINSTYKVGINQISKKSKILLKKTV